MHHRRRRPRQLRVVRRPGARRVAAETTRSRALAFFASERLRTAHTEDERDRLFEDLLQAVAGRADDAP